MCPWADVREAVRGLRAAELIGLLRDGRFSAYRQEAWLEAFKETATTEERRALDTARVGIYAEHALHALRQRLRERVEQGGPLNSAQVLLLWGAQHASGEHFFSELGEVIRLPGLENHVASHPELYGEDDAAELAMRWVHASGVTNTRSLSAAGALIRNHFLSRIPGELFVRLNVHAEHLARELAGGDPKLTVLIFRCLQRIAAWRHRNEVRWNAGWLRGRSRSRHAIPGTTTDYKVLTAILHQRVLEKVQNHSNGMAVKRAATYRILVELRRGNRGDEEVARGLNTTLDDLGLRPWVEGA